MRATIQYENYQFQVTGRPQFGRKDAYIADAPGGIPHSRNVTWTVQQIFREPSFADNAARYAALLAALQTTEGTLLIVDERGTQIVNKRVRVVEGDRPTAWGQNVLEVSVSFTCREDLSATSSPFTATYTADGGSPVTLPNVSGFKTAQRTERPSTNTSWRRETNGTATLSGKVRPNPQDTPANRRSFLLAQRAAIEGLDSLEGTLVYGSFNRAVQVDAAEADLKDGTDELEYTISVSYRLFPSGDFADCEYTLGQSDDLDKHERTTTVRGKVRADDEDGARAKADDILALYTDGRVLHKKDVNVVLFDGDTDGTAFADADFTFSLTEVLSDAVSYELNVTTKDDLKSGQVIITYSGSVTATTSSGALTEATSLGDGKYSIRLSSSVEVSTTSTAGSDAQFQKVTFSYEYLTKGTVLYAEVSSETNTETFGSSVQTVSGYATAETQANALTLARSFKLSGLLLRSNKETPHNLTAATNTQFVRVDFSYSYHLAAVAGSIQYGKKTGDNFTTREVTTAFTGTAWSTSESAADALISALAAGVSGRWSLDERTSNFDNAGSTSAFISRGFSLVLVSDLAAGSDDILQAEASVETVYSVNHAVITPIPFGTPYVQANCGLTPGLVTASGTITALTAATALTWARGFIPGSGYPEPPREKVTTDFYSMSGTDVRCYRVEFSYSARYASLAM